MIGNTNCLVTVGEIPQIDVLERVHTALMRAVDDRAKDYNQILQQFQEREDIWLYLVDLLDRCTQPHTMHLLYQTLRINIQKRWEQFNPDVQVGIQDYVMTKFVDATNNSTSSDSVTTMIDQCVVAIIIQQYPHAYPNVINDIISITSPYNIENIVQVLHFLLDEIYAENAEFSIPYRRINEISNSLFDSAEAIFNVIQTVLNNSLTQIPLMKKTLLLLRHFIKSIPPEIIVQNNIFQTIIQHALPKADLVSESLSFLAEVYSLSALPVELIQNTPSVFQILIRTLAPNLEGIDMDGFQGICDHDSFKVKSLSNCLTTFLLKLSNVIEIPELAQELNLCVQWVFFMSGVMDSFVQRTCAEFWRQITSRIWKEIQTNQLSEACANIYMEALPQLRRLYIRCIVKPQEFIIKIDDDTVVREEQRNTEEIDLFQCQKKLLLLLTNIENEDMITAMNELLNELENDFDTNNFNAFCYAVGAISGSLDAEAEKEFIIRVVQTILGFNQRAEGDTELKALISAGLSYILSQYPRFLAADAKSDSSIFKTLISKLFEFMSLQNIAVKEMAVNSLALISKSQTIGKLFNRAQGNEVPFIVEIMQDLPNILANLDNNPLIIRLFGIISAIVGTNPRKADKTNMLMCLVQSVNEKWNGLLTQWAPRDYEFCSTLLFFLECNAEIAANIKDVYGEQLALIFNQLMEVYTRYSTILGELIQEPGFAEGKEAQMQRKIKSTIVRIINEYISKTPNVGANVALMDPIVNNIISEYSNNHPDTRVPEVLALVTSMSVKMKDQFAGVLPQVFSSVFDSTLAMIQADMTVYLDFRVPFFKFVDNIVKNHINIMLSAPPQVFDTFISTIKLGAFHANPDVCIISLQTIETLFNNIRSNGGNKWQPFLNDYFIPILVHVIEITTDTYHKFAFKEEAQLLRKLLSTQCHLLNPTTIAREISGLFPNRDPESLEQFMALLIHHSTNAPEFNNYLTEFLVSTKLFSRRDQEISIQQQDELMGVAGMNGPAEPEDFGY